MPPKTKTSYFCDRCGHESPRWEGQCSACGAWNSLVEAPREGNSRRNRHWAGASAPAAQELSRVSLDETPRIGLSSNEVDRVLGGGLVPGSVVLIAGDPGIGKSTLLLRVASDVAAGPNGALYVSGEESATQIRIRADRLGVSGDRLFLLQATGLGDILAYLESHRPALVVVDSIQTVFDERLESTAGSVAQIRECARALMEWAKTAGVPAILTGHVTKGGDIAGPRVLEHMVDVVLYMEGDPVSSWRLLRTVKNRFGSANEVGVFEMTDRGLIEVEDPSRAFVPDRHDGVPGSVIVSALEGTRPLLVEVQALTNPSVLPAPRRVASGPDFNRLLIICAVLGRQAGLSLSNQDVVVNVTGGLRVGEPAADLGVALAIASSLRNAPLPPRLAAVGEIGLSGEVRRVPQIERRIAEIGRLGLTRCIVPAGDAAEITHRDGLEITPVKTLAEAVAASIGKNRRAYDSKIEPRLRTPGPTVPSPSVPGGRE